jgi:hypothetical protein
LINDLYYGSWYNRIYKFLYKLLLFPQNRGATKELLGNFNINQNNKTIVLGWKISLKKYVKIKHENALIRQSNRIRKSQCYVMDKSYDSEKIHSLIREEISVDSIIPVRKRKRTKFRENMKTNALNL